VQKIQQIQTRLFQTNFERPKRTGRLSRLQGYDAVWPGINLLTYRKKVLYLYHTPETSGKFYHIARRRVTSDFNINNLSVVFV
jgi:hypothetical protein